jgi:thioredoxin-dependent peroxiredoxin
MIDLPKATKGRRMSKKTRKKSVKASTGKVARGDSARPAKAAPAAKTGRAKASKSAKGKKSVTAKSSAAVTKRQAAPRKATAARSTLGKTTAAKTAAARTTAPSPVAKAAADSPSVSKPAPPKAAPQIGDKAALTEGAKAPAFHLPRDGGETISLADFRGRKLVLFFYPRADTPGCTKEAIDFTRLATSFAESQTAILGISADPLKAQETFRDKHELSIPLASDEQHQTLDAYGVWGEKSMYGRTFHGILRTTVLIGANGRIAKIWRNVKVDGHADEVLAAAQSL